MTVISTEIYERGVELVRFPYDFETSEIVRIADYFDGDLKQVASFLCNVWIPDAVKTLLAIIRECDTAKIERMKFLCGHLRSSASAVGARKISETANLLYDACERNEHDLVMSAASSCINALNIYLLQLQRCTEEH